MDIRTIKVRVRIVVEPDEDGFHAYCPGLKGVHACGATEEESVQNAKDAVNAYIHSLLKHNDPIPLSVLESDETMSAGELLKAGFAKMLGISVHRGHAHIEELSIAAA